VCPLPAQLSGVGPEPLRAFERFSQERSYEDDRDKAMTMALAAAASLCRS
jgi:hypothetical protein